MERARRTDPLLRDTLSWSKLKYVVLSLNILGIVATSVVTLVTNNYGHGITNYDPTLPIYYIALLFVPFYATAISAFPALLISALRSGDDGLRKHLRWFGRHAVISLGLAAITPFTSAIIPVQEQSYVVALFAPFYGYCLYRSAKELAPLNRIGVERVLV